MKTRMLCWFSCGGPSAVAAKKAIDLYGHTHEVLVVNCDTRPSEHPDNYRFSEECERWFGQPIIHLKSDDFKTVDEVFERTRYMSGVRGARCTTELKKIPRLKFAQPDDIHVFGYTSGERLRASEFAQRNPDMILKWILIELDMSKRDCLFELRSALIRQPEMYALGFDNNNCPGCVKAQGPWYWSMVRKHFPDTFKRRCEQSRDIGCRLVVLNGERIFLDELPDREFKKPRRKENLSCGPECGIQTKLEFSHLRS